MADLWRVLVARRNTIGLVTASAILAALAISLCMTPKYAAESDIEINAENSAALDVANEPAPPSQLDYAVTLATQANVLQSDTLALAVIHQLNLESLQKPSLFFSQSDDQALPLEQSPRRRTRLLKQFHKNLSVRVLGGTRILQVRYLDRDPVNSAAVVNTLVNDYLEQYFQTRYTATRQASDWLSRQLDDLKHDVEVSQQRLADYQKQTGILGESETNNVVMAKLEEINRQLSAAEANRIVKQAVWQLAKTGDPELISSVAGSSFVQGVSTGTNPAQLGLLPTLRAQEAQLKADIAQASAKLGPSFPKILQMKSQLNNLQGSIDLEIAKVAARAENDYIAAKNAEDMERSLFEKQKQEANKLNDSAIQYGILKREVDASRDLYEGLLGKLKQAGVLAGLRSSNIVIVDPARPAAKPSSPNYLLNLLLGLGAGVIAGIGCALIQDSNDKAIHSPEDVRRVAGMPCLAVIPRISPKHMSSGLELPATSLDSAIDERFRALRTSLLLSNIDHPPKVILVSSALPREGKTTVSVHLARILAQQTSRVLLVDADMRRPSLHREFRKDSSENGLSSLLATPSDDLSGAPIHDFGGGLHVLLAGPRSPFPAEMLASRRMSLALAGWRDQFDYIVLDTPPALAFTDAVVLARCVDAVLLVVRADSTSADTLMRTQEIFQQSHAPLLGAVVNAMNFRSPEYAHYYGYSYRQKELREYHTS